MAEDNRSDTYQTHYPKSKTQEKSLHTLTQLILLGQISNVRANLSEMVST